VRAEVDRLAGLVHTVRAVVAGPVDRAVDHGEPLPVAAVVDQLQGTALGGHPADAADRGLAAGVDVEQAAGGHHAVGGLLPVGDEDLDRAALLRGAEQPAAQPVRPVDVPVVDPDDARGDAGGDEAAASASAPVAPGRRPIGGAGSAVGVRAAGVEI